MESSLCLSCGGDTVDTVTELFLLPDSDKVEEADNKVYDKFGKGDPYT